MSHSLGVRGQHGRIKVGYQVAARLGSFRLSPATPGVWQVEGSIAEIDPFWIAQEAARTLELEVGHQRWIWRTVDLVVGDGSVRGTLTGRPERR